MSKEYTIKSIKETIKNMLLENGHITKILLSPEDNTYKNVSELFGKVIFDYFSSEAETYGMTMSYIDFDVSENVCRNKFIVRMSVKMHKDIIHRGSNDANYLDLLTGEIIDEIITTFGEDIKRRRVNCSVEESISNYAVSRKDKFAERQIEFEL